MSRYLRLLPAAAIAASLVITIACVGSDPDVTPVASGDAGGVDSATPSEASSSSSGGGGPTDAAAAAEASDARSDACDPLKPFGPATPFLSINTDAQDEGQVRFSRDGTLAFYTRGPSLNTGVTDLWVATKGNDFKDGIPLPGINPADGCCFAGYATLSPDGLELVFQANEGGQYNTMWHATRQHTTDDFSGRASIAVFGPAAWQPIFTFDGSGLYYTDHNDGDAIKRASKVGSAFTAGVAVGVTGRVPMITADEKALYFARDGDIQVATRESTGAPWVEQGKVPGLPRKEPSYITPDGCTMYLTDIGSADGGLGPSTVNVWSATRAK